MHTVIDGELYDQILAHAAAACIGGSSAVHADKDDRQRKLEEDQKVGQFGEYAICRWFGDPGYYFDRRVQINQNPLVGDGGVDYLTPGGLHVDVKASLMRVAQPHINYTLLVRDRERHADNYYVLALADQVAPPVTVWLMGWAHDSEFRWKDDRFSERGDFPWAIGAHALHPMAELGDEVKVAA